MAQALMVVTVTPNPSLDRTLSVPAFQPGALHRARLVRRDLSGKGINVSRALRALDVPSRIMGFAGGWTGRALREGLLAEGYEIQFVDVGEEIRQNITLMDESTGQITKINEPGPTIGPHHIAALEDQIEQTVRPGDVWAFSGSLPPGAPPDLYARLVNRVQARGGLAFLDSSGLAFRAGMSARPFAIKINVEEAAEFLGCSLDDDRAVCSAAHELQTQGVKVVVLTRGAQGLVLEMRGELVIAVPPTVTVRSPIGAGDATLAGLLWAILDRCDPITTARRAVACGTAAAMQEGTAVGDRALIERLLNQVQIVGC